MISQFCQYEVGIFNLIKILIMLYNFLHINKNFEKNIKKIQYGEDHLYSKIYFMYNINYSLIILQNI